MVETRQNTRHKVLKVGAVDFNGGAIDCTVRNLSLTGAAIEIANQQAIPDKFTLVVPRDNLRLPCHVVWRKAYRIGVRFE
jgi:hypothetical protein